MKRILASLLALWFAYVPAHAGSMALLGSGSVTGGGGGGGGYTGPGDTVASNWKAWWGLRAFSAAYAAPGNNPAIDVQTTGGGSNTTINILTDGSLDVASLATWIGLHGTAVVVKLWDQSGNGNHLTNSFGGSPTIQNGSVTGFSNTARPAVVFAGAQSVHTPNSSSVLNPALTYYGTFIVPGTGESGIMGSSTAASAELISNNSADTINIYANSAAVSKAATHNVWHTGQGLFAATGTNSLVNVDGVDGTTGTSPGTFGWPSGSPVVLGVGNFGDFFTGNWVEGGVNASDYGSTARGTINSQAKTWWTY